MMSQAVFERLYAQAKKMKTRHVDDLNRLTREFPELSRESWFKAEHLYMFIEILYRYHMKWQGQGDSALTEHMKRALITSISTFLAKLSQKDQAWILYYLARIGYQWGSNSVLDEVMLLSFTKSCTKITPDEMSLYIEALSQMGQYIGKFSPTIQAKIIDTLSLLLDSVATNKPKRLSVTRIIICLTSLDRMGFDCEYLPDVFLDRLSAAINKNHDLLSFGDCGHLLFALSRMRLKFKTGEVYQSLIERLLSLASAAKKQSDYNPSRRRLVISLWYIRLFKLSSIAKLDLLRQHILDVDMREIIDSSRFQKRLAKRLAGLFPEITFESEVLIGPYPVDLLVRNCKLIIEVDGPSHFYYDGTRTSKDIKRQLLLEKLGYTVIHVSYKDWTDARKEKRRDEYLRQQVTTHFKKAKSTALRVRPIGKLGPLTVSYSEACQRRTRRSVGHQHTNPPRRRVPGSTPRMGQ